MLRIIIGATLLVVVAFVGYRRSFVGLRLPTGARIIFLTGTEFILVGVALGGGLLNILDQQALRSLTPLFSLALGYVGLIYGIQLERDKVRRLPGRYLLATVVQATVALVVIWVAGLWLLETWVGSSGPPLLLASLVLAAAAANTGQTTLALVVRELRIRSSRFLDLLRTVASLDAIVGLTVAGLAFSLGHHTGPVPLLGAAGLQWFALSAALGVALGLLLHLVTQYHCSQEELVVFGLGMVLFSSGLALYLKLSPLFINMIIGITMANLPGAHDRMFSMLVRLEKPFYIVLLILAGAVWRLDTVFTVVFAALYLVLRMVGKAAGGYLASRLLEPELEAPRTMGLALNSLGGVAIAIVLNYAQIATGPEVSVVVTAVLFTVIVTELVSPNLIRVVLRLPRRGAATREGET